MHQACCYRSALSPDTGFCGECGGPLLRCAAFEECSGLLDSDARCGVCVVPELWLDAGAQAGAKAGGALALPLVVRNASQVARPLFLHSLQLRQGDGEWQAVRVPWERLDAQQSAPTTLTLDLSDRAGTQHVDVLLVVASRWRWREEVLAFTAGMEIRVDADQALTVQQNITYASEASQTGATIYAPLRMENPAQGTKHTEASQGPRQLELMRAGRMERELGLRAGEDGLLVSRGARLEWKGWDEHTAPADGPIVVEEGLVYLGRARAKSAGGPNDARLMVRGPKREVDEPRSMEISRRHLGLFIENDRLMLRVESERGVWLNGHHLGHGSSHVLKGGDLLSAQRQPLPGASLRVHFEAHHNVVHAVQICCER